MFVLIAAIVEALVAQMGTFGAIEFGQLVAAVAVRFGFGVVVIVVELNVHGWLIG